MFVSPLRASLVAQTVKRLPGMWETWVQFLGREDPLEKEMATHSSTLAWRIPWRKEPGRLLVRGVAKSWTRLSDYITTNVLYPFGHPDDHSAWRASLPDVLQSKSQPALSRTWFSSSFRSSLETYFLVLIKKENGFIYPFWFVEISNRPFHHSNKHTLTVLGSME